MINKFLQTLKRNFLFGKQLKKGTALFLSIAILATFSPLVATADVGQSNSMGGELITATIAGSSGMKYIGQNSSIAKRTVAWTRNAYIGAVNVYYARESGVTAGYCTAPDPGNQPGWTLANGVGIVTSSYEFPSVTVGGLVAGTDYCLLVRSGSASEPWAVTDQFEIDNTAPTITSRETQDLDADGKIDAVKLTFSDEILDSSVNAANFAIGAYANPAFSSNTNGDVADNNVIYITFDEAGASDSGATPNVTYTAGTLTDLADNALASNGPTAATDNAKPVITAVQEFDVDADGKIDEVMLTYSESIDDSTLVPANYTIGGTAVDGVMDTTSTNGVDTNVADDATITIIVTAGVAGTEKKAVVYTAGNTADLAVAPNTGTTQTVAVGASITDSAKPVATSVTIKDIDLNGKIDRLDTTWSEDMVLDATSNDHGFDWMGHGNGWTAPTAFSIAAGTTLNIPIPEAGQSTTTSVTEIGGANGIELRFSALGGTGPTDASGNEAGNYTWSIGSPLAPIADEALPQIASSTGLDSDNDGKTNSYTITFSENLTNKGVAAGNVNFSAKNTTTNGVITISTVDIGNSTANKVVLNLDDADADNYTGPMTFSYTAGVGAIIEDASAGTNDFANVTDFALTDDVLPVLLSARGGSNGGTADVLDNAGEIIDLIFSEPMNAGAPSLANLEAAIDFANGAFDADSNLGGGTNTVTRVTMNISNDTYRVTRGNTSSADLVTPGNDTVAIGDGTNVLDIANNQANTVPAAVTVAIADITAPAITARETKDLDADGKIDAIKITFDDNVKDSTVTIGNFDVAGYVGEAFSSNTNGDVADNDVIYITFTEGAGVDTDAIPTLRYTAGTLTDDANNAMLSNGPIASTDLVTPVFVSARATSNTNIEVTFSENIQNPVFGSFTSGDFTATAAAVAGGTKVNLTVNALGNTAFTSADLDIAASAVEDTSVATNDFAGIANQNVADAQVPTFVSARATSNTNIEVTFSENIQNPVFGIFTSGDFTATAAAVAGGTKVNLTVNALGNTAFMSADLDIAASAVEDTSVVTNDFAGIANQNIADAQVPTFVSARATSNTNIEVTFSENIQNPVFGSFTSGDFTATAAAVVGGTKVNLTVNALGDTAFTSADLDIAASAVEDTSVATNDFAGIANQNVADAQVPTITAVAISDANADGTLDTATITLSEALANTAAAANGFDVTSVANHGVCNTESADPDGTATLVLTFACATQYTAVGDLNIALTANAGVKDIANNQVASITLTSASTPAITDNAAPLPLSAAITKAVSNGNLQNGAVIEVTFSEPVTPAGVANANWKFTRNGVEASAIGNWTDGATIAYAVGSSATNVKMTLSASTTSGIWTSGAKLNLSANNIATIADGSANLADMSASDITISGLIGPSVDAIAVTAQTSTTATIGWISGANTTSNKVNYGTTPSLGSSSILGTPGEGGTTHSINLSALTAGTLYYYQVCSTSVSETCSAIQNLTTDADETAPNAPVITTAPATTDANFYTIAGTVTADATSTQTVKVLVGANTVGTVIVPKSGTNWSVVVTLPQTVATIFKATSTDEAGNVSADSNTVTITEAPADATAPVIANTVFNPNQTAFTVTEIGAGTFTITATDAFDDVDTLTVTVNGTVVADNGNDNVGTYVYTLVAGDKTTGIHTFNIQVIDAAGNLVTKAVAYSVVADDADATVPTISSTVFNPNQTAFTVTEIAAGTFTVVAADTFDDDDTLTVKVNGTTVVDDGDNNTGNYVYTLVAGDKTTGIHTFNIQVTDTAGNLATKAVAYSVVANGTDTTAPDQDVSILNITHNSFDVVVSADEAFDLEVIFSDTVNLINTIAINNYDNVYNTSVKTNSMPEGLTPNTVYYAQVSVRDAALNVQSKVYAVKTVNNADVSAPTQVLSFTELTATSVKVFASADESFDSKLRYSTSADISGSSTAESYDAGFGTYKTVVVNSLTADTLYYFESTVKDAVGNERIKVYAIKTLPATVDTAPPVFISSSPNNAATSISTTAGTATVTFDEDITIVDQSKITIVKASDSSNVKGADATVNLKTLTINYNALEYSTSYKITVATGAVKDAANNATTVDTIIYFTTASTSAPTITGLTLQNVTNTKVDIAWSTDIVPTTAQYKIGTTAYNNNIKSWTTLVPGGATSGTRDISSDAVTLTANTTYWYQVKFVKDGATVESTPMQFTTARGVNGLYVDQISMVKSMAQYNATTPWTNGWHFRFSISTDNLAENQLQMMLDNWVSGANTLATSGNVKMLASQNIVTYNEAAIAAGTAVTTDYGDIINISGMDNNPNIGGQQFFLDVFVKIPSATQASGSYSTTYGVKNSKNAGIAFGTANIAENATNTATNLITLTEDVFTNKGVTLVNNTDYTISGLPTGVTASIVTDGADNTKATLTLTGTGTVTTNTVISVTIKANALDGTVDSNVATFTITDVAPVVAFGTASINESATNTATNVITLTNDTFETLSDTLVVNTDYTIAGLPDGVTASIITDATDTKKATLTLTGTPTTPLTANATITVTVLHPAFTGTASAPAINFTIADEVVVSTSNPASVVENATLDQTFTITLTKDQLTAVSNATSIKAELTLGGDLAGLTIGTVIKTSVSVYTVQLTGNLTRINGSGTITLAESQLEDDSSAVTTVTITAAP